MALPEPISLSLQGFALVWCEHAATLQLLQLSKLAWYTFHTSGSQNILLCIIKLVILLHLTPCSLSLVCFSLLAHLQHLLYKALWWTFRDWSGSCDATAVRWNEKGSLGVGEHWFEPSEYKEVDTWWVSYLLVRVLLNIKREKENNGSIIRTPGPD